MVGKVRDGEGCGGGDIEAVLLFFFWRVGSGARGRGRDGWMRGRYVGVGFGDGWYGRGRDGWVG